MLRHILRRTAASAGPGLSQAHYIGQMLEAYKQSPESVHPAWQAFFEKGDTKKPASASTEDERFDPQDSLRIAALYLAYANFAHDNADIDPINPKARDEEIPKWLDYRSYGFTEADLEREFLLATRYNGIADARADDVWQLQELLDKLKSVYCGKVAWEYGYIQSRFEKNWIRHRIENDYPATASVDTKKEIHRNLVESHLLDDFLQTKFQTVKRYGLEGLDGLIVSLNALIDQAAKNGVEEVVIGVAHRGRFNILANILRYDLSLLFGHFSHTAPMMEQLGDVMYHISSTCTRQVGDRSIEITLLPNPSHLEAVNPVVQGNVFSKQQSMKDKKKAMGIIIHGDAAVTGQGIVYEAIQMQDLHDYSTAGTVHIVTNNNIGFTADQKATRSTRYSTDIGKTVSAPVFHVNGESVEDIDWVSRLASDYRQEFQTDIFLDLIGYRKNGHNEVDDPTMTNPTLYRKINAHEKISDSYTKKLIKEGVIDDLYNATLVEGKKRVMNDALARAKEFPKNIREAKDIAASIKLKQPEIEKFDLRIGVEELRALGIKACTLPENFAAHPLVRRNYETRLKNMQAGTGLDWALGEVLAWAQMLAAGIHVRLSGEDVERGTFSHRHAVINDQNVDMKKYCPLNNMFEGQTQFLAANSHLSEMGVLGFEYGYAMDNPNALTIWEAQFGDFANGAQIIIDNFIASGEQKWGTANGLVMLLPHGYDGQGPEHSSCRIERFLALSGDDPSVIPDYSRGDLEQEYNIRVIVPSTPANIANFLKRQMTRARRRPLIVASPKRLLRHKLATSNIEEIAEGRVMRCYDEQSPDVQPEKVRKVLFCCGQVYYDLWEERARLWDSQDMSDIAIVRLEQLCPFPFDRVGQIFEKYPNASIHWVQEEPRNSGGYTYVRPRFITVLKDQSRGKLGVVSRPSASATATGYADINKQQLSELLTESFE